MNNTLKQFKVFYQNVRGLRTKTNEFYNNSLLLDTDVVMITETWLHDSILDSELCNDKYIVFRRDRGTLGGGVMLMCAPYLQARMRPEWHCNDLECVWVTVPSTALGLEHDLHMAAAYIPPNSSLPSRIQLFVESLLQIRNTHPNDHFIIAGDFNLPCIDWTLSEPIVLRRGSVDIQSSASHLIDQISYMGFAQFNDTLNRNKNILDLIISDSSVSVNRSNFHLVMEDTHHPSLTITASDFLIPPLKAQPRIKYIFGRADYNAMNESLNDQNWTFLTDNDINIETVIDRFYYILNSCIQTHVPKVHCSSTYKYPIWYSKSLINIIKEKFKVHKDWKKYNNPNDYAHFTELRRRQKEMQSKCYNLYLKISQHKIKTNPKYFWSYIKSKKQNSCNYPQQMTYNNVTINDRAEICSAFNNFFEKNFNKPAGHSSSTQNTYFHTDTIHDIEVTSEHILKLIKNLDTSKGAGCDNIPPIFFVKCAEPLSLPISIIFNRCFREGFFPNIWKKAHIVPIHKKGPKSTIENYRPISILNVLSKLCEKVVHAYIYPMLSASIPSEQHGFIKGRSTATNLGVFIDYVLDNIDGGLQVDVIYTDFEKAFDRVDHIILLRKLNELGVHGNLLRWMDSYLRNRSQAVVVGSSCSDFIEVSSGVPQGSILGPLLYATYLYDVGRCLKHARFLMYADDTKVFMTIQGVDDCVNLQTDLDRLNHYYAENRIDINVRKCSSVSFTRKTEPLTYNYTLNNGNITKLNTVKDLGVMMDSKLTFSEHIDMISTKAYRNLGFVLRISKPFSDVGCLRVLYFSFVRSILEYCSVIWNPQYITYIQSLEKLQLKFLKHLHFRHSRCFIEYQESCDHYNIMPLNSRRTLIDMSFLHGIINSDIDCVELASKILCFCVPKLRTRHTTLFATSCKRTNYARNSLVNRLHRSYNKELNMIDIFRYGRAAFRRELVRVLSGRYKNTKNK